MAGSPLKAPARAMVRWAPSALRMIMQHFPTERGRWTVLDTVRQDPTGSRWLAGLENPTKTKRGFGIWTLPGDVTSDWIKLLGHHEACIEKFIVDNLTPEGTFLDIGANIGYYSLSAAYVGKSRVISFEPQRTISELLKKSVTHNHLEGRVTVERLALADQPGRMTMEAPVGHSGLAHLAEIQDSTPAEDIVSVVVLDDWLKERRVGRISVCKIDTEGADFSVLRGMQELMKRDGPAIVVELDEGYLNRFGGSTGKIVELLKSHGYDDVSPRYAIRNDRNGYFIRRR